MDIKKIFIQGVFVIFVLVAVLSIYTEVQRANEPDTQIEVNSDRDNAFDMEENTETVYVEDTESESETEETQDSEESRKTMYVISYVNVRSGPATSYERLGSLEENDEVIAIGEAVDGWQKILYNGQEAYVAESYLSETPLDDEDDSEDDSDDTDDRRDDEDDTEEETEDDTEEETEDDTEEETEDDTEDDTEEDTEDDSEEEDTEDDSEDDDIDGPFDIDPNQ